MNKVKLFKNNNAFTWEAESKFFYVFQPSQQKTQETGNLYYVLVFTDKDTFDRKKAWERVDADIVFWLKEKQSERWPWISWLYINHNDKQSFWVNMYSNKMKGPDSTEDYVLTFKDAEYREPRVSNDSDTPF